MSDTTISTIGLLLCLAPAIVHAIEVWSPTFVRWVVNLVLPLFAPGLPDRATSITETEQLAMLDAARDAGPAGKEAATEDYVFIMLFEQRQGALAFISLAVGALYALSLSLDAREPLHLVFAVMAVLFTLVNANQAGVPGFGRHPRISRNGRHVGLAFAPFWSIAAVLNILAFTS
ncbi:MAG: hypothetical protein AAF081_14950 [Actinomycetota bacterium]